MKAFFFSVLNPFHGAGCWANGPRHYACLLKERQRLEREMLSLRRAVAGIPDIDIEGEAKSSRHALDKLAAVERERRST
jgi:hypothetical protein